MKISMGLGTVVALVVGSLLPRMADACATVNVESLNGTGQSVGVVLSMDSTPAVSLPLTLGANASHTDALSVGAGSPSSLHLNAQVNLGSLSGQCSTTISQCIADANVQLHIGLVAPQTGKGKGKGKGNAWGTYKDCFATKEEWFAFKGNPANRHMGKNDGSCLGESGVQLVCNLVLMPTTSLLPPINPPTDEPPTTNPPTDEPPTTNPPTDEPPTTNPPTTNAPVLK